MSFKTTRLTFFKLHPSYKFKVGPDKLRTAWLRISLHAFLFMHLHEAGLSMNSDWFPSPPPSPHIWTPCYNSAGLDPIKSPPHGFGPPLQIGKRIVESLLDYKASEDFFLLGCRDGAVVRALALYVRWVCWFSTLHREVFSRYSGFPSPQKPTFDLICFHC